MKRFFALFLCACTLLQVCACAPAQPAASGSQSTPPDQSSVQEPVDIPFALPFYPEQSLHPVLTANRTNLVLSPLLYEPLFLVDDSFQAVPVLCKSHTVSPDKLVWTFVLHSGITFSDGTPLTGVEVADALSLAREEDSRYAARLACVADISGIEDTVVITLNRPHGSLPLLLDIPIALGEGDCPPGTGPYVFEETDGSALLSARSDWWQTTGLPAEQLLLHPVESGDDLIYSFASGSISLVDVDLMGTNALGFSGSYETWDYATTDLVYLGFNTRGKLLFEDAGLRRALAQAINREVIVQTIFAGHAVASSLPVHPDSPRWDNRLARMWDYSSEPLAQAVEELRESRRVLTLLVNSENAAKVSTAEFIAYQLESVGLTVTLKVLPFEDYAAALKAGNFDLYLGEVVLTADFDLSALLSPYGALNYGGWYSEEITPLLEAAASASPQQSAAHSALLAHLEQQAPIVPICFKNSSVLTRWGMLSGLFPLRNNVFYQLENWIME